MRIVFVVGLFWSGVCLALLWLNYRFPRNRIIRHAASGEPVKAKPDTYALSEMESDLFQGTDGTMQEPAAA